MRQAFGVDHPPSSWVGLRFAALLALLAASLIGAGSGSEAKSREQKTAGLPSTDELPGFQQTTPLWAWADFCNRHRSECASDAAEPSVVRLTKATWEAINAVNRHVNATIKPLSDQDHWGMVDRWDLPEDGYGDCEDYQLLKRKLLRERGLPQRAMRMTVVIDELNEGHAVLMIRTDRGDYILDNKTNAVLPWDETGYVYVKREGHDSMAWTSLGGVTSPTATANR
jgi:predicted transglutaminase-like cysteine proteinase